MSHTGKIILAVVAILSFSQLSYGAVRLVSESEFGVTASSTSDFEGTDIGGLDPNVGGLYPEPDDPIKPNCSDYGHPQCEDIYLQGSVICEMHNSAEKCANVTCCNLIDFVMTVQECPESFNYKTDVEDFKEITNNENMEYCLGYKSGEYGIWTPQDPNTCVAQDIVVPGDYYSKLSREMLDCGTYADKKTCEDAATIKGYCLIPDDSVDNYADCGSEYAVSSKLICSESASSPCRTQCGSYMCLGFTCDTSDLMECSELIEKKEAEGWNATDLADSYHQQTPYACYDNGDIKYVGFQCKDMIPQDTCTLNNGVYGSELSDESQADGNATVNKSCIFMQADGGFEIYVSCRCKSDAYTLSEWCAAEHPSDPDCTSKFYGDETTKCTFDKDSDGQTLTKYTQFLSQDDLCANLTNWKYSYKPENGCVSYSDTDDYTYLSCKIIDPETGTSSIKDICAYCENFITDDKSVAQNLCINGTPKECYYDTGSGKGTTYIGCNCEGYNSVEEFCTKKFSGSYGQCISQAQGGGKECHSSPAPVYAPTESGYTEDDVIRYEKIVCNSNYFSKEEWCQKNPDKIPEGYTCDEAIGIGVPCTVEADGDETKYKYEDYALACPETSNVKNTASDCLLEGETEAAYDVCYDKQDSSIKKYICRCPDTYVSSCEKDYESPGGTLCMFDSNLSGDGVYKYSGCYLSCNSKYASTSSLTAYGCPETFEGYTSVIRGGYENPEKCIMSSSDKLHYICGCPKEFKTLDEWCNEQGIDEQECKNYAGVGKACTRDITKAADGTPTGVLTKYADYAVYCPTDRPLYYSEEDCGYLEGEYDYTCMDENQNQRIVCKCSKDFYGEGECSEIDGIPAEPSGEYCELDGTSALKYKECTVKCAGFLDEYAIAGAFKYLDSSSSTPTPAMCKTEMGSGAVLGYRNKSYCSLNNTQMYPCYCPKEYSECSSEEGLMPAKDALLCNANGTTYYSSCAPTSCKEESPTLVLVDSSGNYATDKAAIQSQYGTGISMQKCSDSDGSEKWEVTCDASTYTETCEYPYEPTSGSLWCVHGNGSTLMKNGTKYYRNGSCKVLQTLGECGKNIILNGNTTTSPYTIFTASSESECRSKYGSGVSAQLCEYGEDQGYKRAYNCFYDASKFKYTTSNCGVRHDLSGDYVIINGKKYYDECKCSSAYQYHKYNCGGLLSGNTCQQEITSEIAASDNIPSNMIGKTLPFYPYCECSADYTEVCDEDGSGRYKGVGQECNGKYKSCECIPDPLPENWSDNYYGCPGGKKPTGVWKDNGCGKKYYQCSVIECGWEYTEKCEYPLLPVGQPCQDNQGNIGGYKSCTCPADYKVCPAGQVGEGEPCNLKGVSYYKSCKTQDTCDIYATETCTGPLQIGVNPCIRDNTTYYEKCVCANGYTKVCGEGEVGVGNYCELNGIKYYKECAKPEDNMCTEGHVTACDTNQISYSPCVDIDGNGKQVVKYLCKCPSNWYTSSSCVGGILEGEHCTQKDYLGNTTDYYSKCSVTSSCSNYQDLTYKVCNESQTGDGESCVSTLSDGSTVTKYATCVDSNNCVATGFKYSCSGYDTSALGESCVDANGNRLYKSCPCPSSYTTCSEANTSKGSKCVPIQADGSFGTPVYSSCRCDSSKYKYTCTPEESGNKGVIAPNTSNYCELTEMVTETTTDEDGNQVTSNVEKKVRYYSSCECSSEYKYTCASSANGEVVPSEYENDYCQINSTKFYKGCDCSEDYTTTSAECDAQGAIVDTTSGYCVIKGSVPSATRATNTNLYKGCVCKNGYKECSDEKYDQSEVEGCTIDSNKTLYPQCKCNDTYKYTCVKTGRNQGVEKGYDVCLEITVDDEGASHITEKYSECRCSSEYNKVCDSTAYDQSGEDYCSVIDQSGTEIRRYKKCVCNSLYYNTSTPVLYRYDQTTYCKKLGLSVNSDITEPFCEPTSSTVKYPHYNICK